MKELRFFLFGFFLSLPFWLGLNFSQARLEDLILNQVYYPPSEVLLAQVSRPSPSPEKMEIQAKSVLLLKILSGGRQQLIFEKRAKDSLPIASLTKLMTSLIVIENRPLTEKVPVTREAISQEGAAGNLRIGEQLAVSEFLKMTLVESSNDAAQALAQSFGREKFVELMNLKAEALGMTGTKFSTPTGLEDEGNFSTARDLAILAKFILQEQPELLAISRQREVSILNESGTLHHRVLNTNELLSSWGEVSDLKIIGGKTGYTDEAGGCILLVLGDGQGHRFISILLGARDSESRFVEMRKIIALIRENN